MRKVTLSTLFVFVTCVSRLFAQSGSDHDEPALPLPSVSDGLLPALMKLGLAVVVVIGLIYVFMLVLKKLSLGKTGLMGGKGNLQVIERSYFAQKKFVCLMRVGEKVLLLGVSDNNINLVADVSDQDFAALEQAKRESKQLKGKGLPFRSYLQQARTHLSTLTSKM